mmetsp:Transcript_43647/g.102964  ORF Transcript_43647/g.102964 Transcript_43647/m.102964 type:complete len:782 (-) Transcript_43647:302-2647(-)
MVEIKQAVELLGITVNLATGRGERRNAQSLSVTRHDRSMRVARLPLGFMAKSLTFNSMVLSLEDFACFMFHPPPDSSSFIQQSIAPMIRLPQGSDMDMVFTICLRGHLFRPLWRWLIRCWFACAKAASRDDNIRCALAGPQGISNVWGPRRALREAATSVGFDIGTDDLRHLPEHQAVLPPREVDWAQWKHTLRELVRGYAWRRVLHRFSFLPSLDQIDLTATRRWQKQWGGVVNRRHIQSWIAIVAQAARPNHHERSLAQIHHPGCLICGAEADSLQHRWFACGLTDPSLVAALRADGGAGFFQALLIPKTSSSMRSLFQMLSWWAISRQYIHAKLFDHHRSAHRGGAAKASDVGDPDGSPPGTLFGESDADIDDGLDDGDGSAASGADSPRGGLRAMLLAAASTASALTAWNGASQQAAPSGDDAMMSAPATASSNRKRARGGSSAPETATSAVQAVVAAAPAEDDPNRVRRPRAPMARAAGRLRPQDITPEELQAAADQLPPGFCAYVSSNSAPSAAAPTRKPLRVQCENCGNTVSWHHKKSFVADHRQCREPVAGMSHAVLKQHREAEDAARSVAASRLPAHIHAQPGAAGGTLRCTGCGASAMLAQRETFIAGHRRCVLRSDVVTTHQTARNWAGILGGLPSSSTATAGAASGHHTTPPPATAPAAAAGASGSRSASSGATGVIDLDPDDAAIQRWIDDELTVHPAAHHVPAVETATQSSQGSLKRAMTSAMEVAEIASAASQGAADSQAVGPPRASSWKKKLKTPASTSTATTDL